MKEKVSLIIPVYNEENNITQCLNGILSQTTQPDEMIIIDDNSTDKTLEIIKEFSSFFQIPIDIYIKRKEDKGIAMSRMLGTLSAKNDIIVSTDGDSILSSNWIENGLENFIDKEVSAVTGKVAPLPEQTNIITKLYANITNSQHIGRGFDTMFRRSYCDTNICYRNQERSSDSRLWNDLKKHGKVIYDPRLISYTSLPTYSQKVKTNSFLLGILSITSGSVLLSILGLSGAICNLKKLEKKW